LPTPLAVGGEQVDDLDARGELLDLRRLLGEGRRRPVDRKARLGLHGLAVVDRVTDHVEDAAEALGPDGHRDGAAGVAHGHAADQPVGRVHRDGADGVLAEVLGDLERQVLFCGRDAGVRDLQCAEDLRQLAVAELDVDNRTDDLDDFARAGRGAVGAERKLGHGCTLLANDRGAADASASGPARE